MMVATTSLQETQAILVLLRRATLADVGDEATAPVT